MISRTGRWMWTAALAAAVAAPTWGAGILTPIGVPDAPVQILDHHVDVVINNGFARTEVIQTFFNPNAFDLEAIYSFPIPRSASLSEFTITAGEREIHGEVLPRAKARAAYEEERDRGSDAGLAEKNSYHTFEFFVAPVRAGGETGIRFVYYQPIEIDTGIGRYVYPMEEGGTDEAALSFWTTNDTVEGVFSMRVEVKSAWPIAEVRAPGFGAEAEVNEHEDGRYVMTFERRSASLDRDFVLYYRLAEDLPGRVEMLTHRSSPDEPGTYMMILTPGLDLPPLAAGADYVFVLDTSGSMDGGKIKVLAQGVSDAIGRLDADDRYRVVVFNNGSSEITRGWTPATEDHVARTLGSLGGLRANGGTNLYDGLKRALTGLDDDRATSIVLVTDAVTNTGVVDPAAFHQLMKQYDIRVFGFLMGNSANWPLMRTICEATGGFYAQVSTSDDILGQIMLAKGKITHECLHDATLSIRGVNTWDTTGEAVGKVYRGQQLVLFGRYEKAGAATVALQARLSGEDRAYRADFAFPEIDEQHPEIERLWALARIDDIQWRADAGLLSPGEAEQVVTGLGVDYQIVTDHTSMVVLSDQAFADRGIERKNRDRVATERAAQSRRAAQPARSARVDGGQPMFQNKAPSVGRGGGAIDPLTAALVAGLGGLALAAARRRRDSTR